jgi:glyoxylate/hydroxypyruvate reductase A
LTILLVKSGGEGAVPDWQRHFADSAPHIKVHWWDDPAIQPEQVEYVLVWEPDHGRLANMPNLRMVLSTAAGVDHITRDPAWPAHLPLVRMGGEETAQRMGEYVSLACLGLLRDVRRMMASQLAEKWDYFENPRCALDVRVGIMGMGNLGTRAAQMVAGLGFQVAGWSRSRKELPGIESFAGPEEFEPFLARSDILVCLLPDTPDTRGTIRAETIAMLPPGAGIVNAARGTHVVFEDLVAALDIGHLGGAVLDVFTQEPLPPGHPAWSHPRILVTSHLASLATRSARVRYVADAIRRHEAGEALPNLYDPLRGY